jgi:D-alanyl-D-alanine carboxypeptidase
VSDLGIPADYGARRGMPPLAEALELVSIGASPDGRDIRLSPAAAAAWARMRDAADADGIRLVAISGFRSVERQVEIIRGKLAAGGAIDAILSTIAAPGYSEHHTGRAIDLGVPGEPPLTEDFERTPAFQWLRAHAGRYGFHLSYPRGNPHGMAYEPWHWCHMGWPA